MLFTYLIKRTDLNISSYVNKVQISFIHALLVVSSNDNQRQLNGNI